MLQYESIIRNRLKIKVAISNAKLFIDIQGEYRGFYNYLKIFLSDGKPVVTHWKSIDKIPASTLPSDAISSNMKKWGFKIFGTNIYYAHLQTMGYVNDHLADCHC